jgi:hypothetical protein
VRPGARFRARRRGSNSERADRLLVEHLREEFSQLDFKAGARPFSLTGTVRQLLETEGCFGRIAVSSGGDKAKPVWILAFDKTPESNWRVGWHQVRVIAVKHRRDLPGFGTWTLKGGIPHVEAPLEILREMFSLRLHLDDCGSDNGAFRVPGGWAGSQMPKDGKPPRPWRSQSAKLPM